MDLDEDTQLPHKRRAEGLVVGAVSEEEQIRHKIFLKVLSETDAKGNIDMQLVRALCFEGLPDVHEIRSKYWKLLLNYLSPQPSTWEATLAEKRSLYQSWKDELIVNPHNAEVFLGKPPVRTDPATSTSSTASATSPAVPIEPIPTDLTDADHPLNTTSESTWQKFFDNDKILREIDKDVRRTLPDTEFFIRTHHDQMLRILFLYAKLNPGVKYVQGMNEVLAPIYYLFANDKDTNNNAYAEADAFWCFTNLMAEIRDHFLAALDRSNHGINFKMQQLYDLLREKDVYLYNHLAKTCQISPQFFAFRWISLLLTQEFELHRVFRLWDAILADENRFTFLLYLCVSMLVCIRDTLLEGDFTVNLKLLQRYPEIGVNTLVTKALWLHGSMGLPPASKHQPPHSGGVVETETQARSRLGASRPAAPQTTAAGGWMSYVASSVSVAVTSLKAAAEDRLKTMSAAQNAAAPISWDNPAPVGVGDAPRPAPAPAAKPPSTRPSFGYTTRKQSSSTTTPPSSVPQSQPQPQSSPSLVSSAAPSLVSVPLASRSPRNSSVASSTPSLDDAPLKLDHIDTPAQVDPPSSNADPDKDGLLDVLAKFAVVDETLSQATSPLHKVTTTSPAIMPRSPPTDSAHSDPDNIFSALEDAPNAPL